MNKIFKVVYNHATQTWTVVSELARGKSKSQSKGKQLKNSLVVAAVAAVLSTTAQASTPTDQEYVDGQIKTVNGRISGLEQQVGMALPQIVTTAQGYADRQVNNAKAELTAEINKKADQSALDATNNRVTALESGKADASSVVSLAQEATRLEAEKANKKYVDEVDSKVENINNIVTKMMPVANTVVTTLTPKVAEHDQKIADLEANKANASDVAKTKADLTAEIAKKADTSSVVSLAQEATRLEAEKANKSDLDGLAKETDVTKALHEAGNLADSRADSKVAKAKAELTAEIAKKADTSSVVSLAQEATRLEAEKANKADVTTALYEAGKVADDRAESKVQAAKAELTAEIAKKADISSVVSLAQEATRLEAEKANKKYVDDEIAKKAEQSALDATNANVAKKADQTALDATNQNLAKKAEQSALEATNNRVTALEGGKADKSAVNQAIATLTSAVNDKADASDVTSLETRVGSIESSQVVQDGKISALESGKADKAELATLATKQEVAALVNLPDLSGVATKNELNTGLATKADKSAVNQAIATLTSAVNDKADASDVTSLETRVDSIENAGYLTKTVADPLYATKSTETVANDAKNLAEANKTALSDVKAEVANKADASDLARTDATVTGLTQTVSSQAVALNNAVNQLQTMGGQLTRLDNRVATVEYKVEQLNREFENGMATQAALSGLFQPYNVGKANFTMALGGYNSQTAVAIGTGYRFNENIAGKAALATSTSNGGTSYNMGVNFEW